MQTSRRIGDRYEPLDFVGEGTMGIVYRGRDTQTDNLIAIKVLKRDFLSHDLQLVDRIKCESEVLHRLNHPNIVKLLTAVVQNENHYLVMEYVAGGSLADVLRKDPQLPVQRVLKIAIALADALTRAHHLKVLHRNIKPTNILLAEDDTPRLTDFGMAGVGPLDITLVGQVVGAIAYLPPEAFIDALLDER